jgi:hypothetical protein
MQVLWPNVGEGDEKFVVFKLYFGHPVVILLLSLLLLLLLLLLSLVTGLFFPVLLLTQR